MRRAGLSVVSHCHTGEAGCACQYLSSGLCVALFHHLLPCCRVKSLEAQFQVRRQCSLCHTHAVISSSISFASHASHHPSPLGEGHTTPDYSFAWFPPECIMACASGLLWCCPFVCLQGVYCCSVANYQLHRPCMLTGLYCSGWVKRGAEGVIVSTMQDAFETAECIADDLRSGGCACPLPLVCTSHVLYGL